MGAGSTVFAYQRIQPAPGLYMKGHVVGVNDKSTQDPRAEIKFLNGGFGPMFVSRARLFTNGQEVKTWEESLDLPISKFVVSSSSKNMGIKPDRPIAAGNFTVATIRPLSGDRASEWFHELGGHIQSRRITAQLTFQIGTMVPLKWLNFERDVSL